MNYTVGIGLGAIWLIVALLFLVYFLIKRVIATTAKRKSKRTRLPKQPYELN